MKKWLPNLNYKLMLLLTISISMIVIISFISYYIYSNMSAEILDQEKQRLAVQSKAVEMNLDSIMEEGQIAVNLIANNPDVQEAFAERDREELLEILLEAYQSVSDQMAQFQFHLPDSTSFLRLHSPENYGDDLSDFRGTVNQANQDRSTVVGIEEGRGGYGLRVVVPMSYQEEHLGTVEMGSSLGENFLRDMQSQYPGEYYLYSLAGDESVAWDEDSNDWIASTEDADPYEISESDLTELESGEEVLLTEGNESYLLLPFRDYNDQVSGY
ncbi:MAG: cache domain-containing protein, partial [Halanaerobium sp.]